MITIPGNGYDPAPAWKSGDGTRTTFHGYTVDVYTKRQLDKVEAVLGTLTMFQGSYNAGGVAASAGTHDGGGVVDLWSNNWDPSVLVGVLRWYGFAAWHRTPAQGFSHHVHAVLVGDANLSSSAASQVTSFFNGRNGLAGNGRDDYSPVPLPLDILKPTKPTEPSLPTTPTTPVEEDDMKPFTQGEVKAGFDPVTTLVIVPAQAGYSVVYLSADMGEVTFRVDAWSSDDGWHHLGSKHVGPNDGTPFFELPADTRKLAIKRVDEEGSSKDAPAAWAIEIY